MRNIRIMPPVVLLLAAIAVPGNNSIATELIRISESNFDQIVPPGKEVDAIFGDYVLRNDQVCAVIAQPIAGRNANMTVRGVAGMLIDFTRRHHGSDQLSCFYPGAGRYLFENAEELGCLVDGQPIDFTQGSEWSGKKIEVTFTGSPVAKDGTSAKLTWSLSDNQAQLAYRITLTNNGTSPIALPIESSLRCDGTSFESKLDDELKLFTAEDRYFGQCYGLMLDERSITIEGEGRKMRLKARSDEAKAADDNVAPGGSVAWSGTITAAQGRPSVLSWARGRSEKLDTVAAELILQSPSGPVALAEVEFLRLQPTPQKEVEQSLGKVRSDSDGVIRSTLLPGDYKVFVTSLGRAGREHIFSIDHGKPRADTLSLPEPSRIRANITDGEGEPIAAKVQLIGLESTSDPDFGPDAAAEAVKNLIYCADGRFEQAVDTGRYKAIVSHGPEYDAVIVEVEVAAGQVVPLEAQLKRSVDSRGWVSADFHSHSTPSGDNVSMQRGRVLNLLAEHIEFAPCTEHNRIDTYADDLESLRATLAMATCTGMELTGSPLPINHQNAFPLHRHEHQQDGGGPLTDADPVKQIERLALWDNNSSKVVQTNHPNIPQILGDADLDGTPDAGFRGMLGWMDVIEVHPPEGIFSIPSADVTPKDKNANPIFFWMQLINLGYRISGVVNTDAHANFHGSGWLRNYLESTSDSPEKISIDEMIHSAEHGHLIMTTGPFLEAQLRVEHGGTTNSYISGDDVLLFDLAHANGAGSAAATNAADGDAIVDKATDELVTKLWIRVQCANWFDINRVQVFANGRPIEELNFTRKTHPERFSSEAIRFECEVVLPKFERDTHLIVATIGEGLKLGPVMGPVQGELPPVAVSNPIFVDVDGSGFQANGDDLGLPFMLPAAP